MDKITVTGIEFFAYHGVLESEQQQGQFFYVDCSFFLDTSVCNNNLNNTVNYSELSCSIIKFCKENTYELIETLANKLAEYLLLRYELISEIEITIHKPHAPIPTSFSDVAISITRKWATCYLAIGSNLGNREENLNLVSKEIQKENKIIELSSSSYIETEPYGVLDQPKFLNGVLKVKTIFTPARLLAFCKNLEKIAGRVKTRHWGERTLDVDILMYANEIIFTPNLIIPHPEMCLRTFVLQPLCEIEPYLIHPIKKMPVKILLEDLLKC